MDPIQLSISPEFAGRFDSLYQMLSRRYELRQEIVRLSQTEFRLITVSDVDILLEELVVAGPDHPDVKDERLPYWAEIWPSAVALADFLLTEIPQDYSIDCIELGCGLGLAGMAARRQNWQVLLSDYQPDALRFAELNWLMNLGETPSLIKMDWRRPKAPQKFTAVLASDIVYEKRFFKPIIQTFRKLLAPEGYVLLSEPGRPVAGEFFKMLPENGFEWEKVMRTIRFKNKSHQIDIYRISFSGSGEDK
ncbi:MAG: methyltransferase domain-containing protein [Calditrichia bacterium]